MLMTAFRCQHHHSSSSSPPWVITAILTTCLNFSMKCLGINNGKWVLILNIWSVASIALWWRIRWDAESPCNRDNLQAFVEITFRYTENSFPYGVFIFVICIINADIWKYCMGINSIVACKKYWFVQLWQVFRPWVCIQFALTQNNFRAKLININALLLFKTLRFNFPFQDLI